MRSARVAYLVPEPSNEYANAEPAARVTVNSYVVCVAPPRPPYEAIANEPSSVPPWMSIPGGPASELTTVAVLEPACVMYGLATVGCSSVFAVTESSAASAAAQPTNTGHKILLAR